MKTIGLIGGMSWNSTIEYYRILNETVFGRLGKAHSAKCLMYSVDFEELNDLRKNDCWDDTRDELIRIAKVLKNGGADFLVICTNTMHMMVEDIESNVNIKVLHIADATGEEIIKKRIKKVALLGTKFTMKGNFYKERLKTNYGIDVIIPSDDEIEIINHIIYDELVKGIIKEESKEKYIRIINNIRLQGAEGVILGCTEIPLLIKQDDVTIPVFDTSKIHALAAVDYALVEGNNR